MTKMYMTTRRLTDREWRLELSRHDENSGDIETTVLYTFGLANPYATLCVVRSAVEKSLRFSGFDVEQRVIG